MQEDKNHPKKSSSSSDKSLSFTRNDFFNSESFDAWVRKNKRWLESLVRNAPDPEAAYQEGLLRIWTNHDRLHIDNTIRCLIAYVIAIMRSMVWLQIRRKKMDARLPTVSDEATHIRDKKLTPEEITELHDRLQKMHEFAESLSAREQQVLGLYMLEKSNNEIAEILDIPAGTVGSHLYRIRSQARKKLEENPE